MQKETHVYSVSEVNTAANLILGEYFSDVWVVGEIAGKVSIYPSATYMEIKDDADGSILKVVIYRSDMRYINAKLEKGEKIKLLGTLGVYSKNGSYQLRARFGTSLEKGVLQAAFELLYEKLRLEGIFDYPKLDIPHLPKKVGVVTSLSGAVLHDIQDTLNNRNRLIEIVVAGARVQGSGAHLSIIEGLDKLIKHGVDVIIIARGGGSDEDLIEFNNELLIRKVAELAQKIPIISAIGHQVDYLLLDLVASVRATTPTQAAQMASEITLNNIYSELSYHNENLHDSVESIIGGIQVSSLSNLPYIISSKIDNYAAQLYRSNIIMQTTCTDQYNELSNQIAYTSGIIEGLNPEMIFQRGFVGLKVETHHGASLLKKLNKGDKIEIFDRENTVTAEVVENKTIKDI
jgi:exodeoxyribonuclease VII large subunit